MIFKLVTVYYEYDVFVMGDKYYATEPNIRYIPTILTAVGLAAKEDKKGILKPLYESVVSQRNSYTDTFDMNTPAFDTILNAPWRYFDLYSLNRRYREYLEIIKPE